MVNENTIQHIKEEVKKVKPKLYKWAKKVTNIKNKYIFFPVIIDGIVDMIRYNTHTKKFDQIEVIVAIKGIEAGLLLNTAYCDKYKRIIISLENPPKPKNSVKSV